VRHSSPILCILAGGRSRRFGSAKTTIRIEGQTLPTWLAARLRPTFGGPVWVSVAPAMGMRDQATFDRVITDVDTFQGPLAAIEYVLRAAEHRDVAFVAADMPLVEPVTLLAMARRLQQCPSASAVMGRWTTPDGRIEPLPSVWRASTAYQLVRDARAVGVKSPTALASRRGVVTMALRDADRPHFLNINRAHDTESLQRRVAPLSVTLP